MCYRSSLLETRIFQEKPGAHQPSRAPVLQPAQQNTAHNTLAAAAAWEHPNSQTYQLIMESRLHVMSRKSLSESAAGSQ
jgi:hypothetical protein